MKLFVVFLILILTMAHTPQNIQAPYVAADFWAQWSSVNPRMALFVLVTPKADWVGVDPIGLTSNTRDMTLPGRTGITFKSAPGITPSIVEQVLGQSGNMEMSATYSTGIFERVDVLAGKWNFATVEVFSACWDNTDLGEFIHHKGNLGEVKDYQTYFTAESRGYIDRLSNDVNTVTQRLCRVKEFRNARCGHTASTVTIDGTAYNITQTDLAGFPAGDVTLEFSSASFSGNLPPVDLFRNGKMTATSGANEGISREISKQLADNDGSIFVAIKRAFPFTVADGDTFTLVAGCGRTIEDCRKYANAANFDGEPFVTGIEAANRIASGN